MMSRGGAASGKKIKIAERRERAWELRKRGYSFQAIADELSSVTGNYSKSSAERDIKHVLEELNKRTMESAADARALDLARLDELLAAWFGPAIGSVISRGEEPGDDAAENAADAMDALGLALQETIPDKQAAEVVLRVLEQRAKMMGLYRQEVALTTPAPLLMGVDLSGIDDEGLDAIIRNVTAALGAGHD